MAIKVALVGEAGGEGDVRERELRVAEHLLDMLEPAAKEIAVRRNAERLLESAGEVVRGETGDGREGVEADLFADVRFDEIADAIFNCGRKSAAVCVWSGGHGHVAEHAKPGLGVDQGFRPTAGEIRFCKGRSKQGSPVVVAIGAG